MRALLLNLFSFVLLLGFTSVMHQGFDIVNSEITNEVCDNNPLDIEYEKEMEFDDEVDRIVINDYLFIADRKSKPFYYSNESTLNFYADILAPPPEHFS